MYDQRVSTRTAESIPDEMLGLELTPAETRLWTAFLAAHATVRRRLERDLDAAGLALSDHHALVYAGAAGEGGVRMADLAEQILLSRSAVTRLVDRLERDGLVERRECEADKRGTFVALTERGREAVRRVAPVHLRGVREAFLDRVPAAKRDEFMAVLGSLIGRQAGQPQGSTLPGE